jgi:peptide-methionine (S)-S-oxide reductase
LISYDELIDIFWNNHDPTSLNRQGPDIGKQYRSAIFFHDEEQKILQKNQKNKLKNQENFKKNCN